MRDTNLDIAPYYSSWTVMTGVFEGLKEKQREKLLMTDPNFMYG